MPTDLQIEQRLSAVEAAVRTLQRERASLSPSANWLDQVSGSFKDEPAFEKVLELARAHRAAETTFLPATVEQEADQITADNLTPMPGGALA